MSKVQTLSSEVQRSHSESHSGKALQSHGDSDAQHSHSSNIYECSCHVYVLLWSCGAFSQYKPHDVIRLLPDWSPFRPLKFTRKVCVSMVLKLERVKLL